MINRLFGLFIIFMILIIANHENSYEAKYKINDCAIDNQHYSIRKIIKVKAFQYIYKMRIKNKYTNEKTMIKRAFDKLTVKTKCPEET